MDLILWRHADAEDGVPDAARVLTGKGAKQAKKMAKWLKSHLPENYRLMVSPAQRAQQTAQALDASYETLKEIGTGASPQGLLAAAGWPDARRTVVVVGHQPTLGRTVALLLCGVETEWSIKKGAIWWLESRQKYEQRVVVRAVISTDML
ncbi:MAG TPA: histidine phosphatase family protein [Burkholderiales bacterium]|nr:histidine phosphatase family protein [Burkholderiales bacterium]